MAQTAFSLLHPKLQQAIFQMGWEELRAIQVQAIHALLDGNQHVIISAPTAGGKTEAAFLPIISALVENSGPSIRALCVSPLKALINDQFGRLELLCTHLDIPVHRWHGDVSASKKKDLRKDPGGILLITPESLESNFINYGPLLSHLYGELDFIVIDELHAFLDNVRGVHLRSLLSRLCFGIGRNPRMVGLSATLGDPEQAKIFFSPDDPRSVLAIDESGGKEIKVSVKAFLARPHQRDQSDAGVGTVYDPRLAGSFVRLLASVLSSHSLANEQQLHEEIVERIEQAGSAALAHEDSEFPDIAREIVKSFDQDTNLVFVNAKGKLEAVAAAIHDHVAREHWPHDPFIVHHGSLSKEFREDAESLLKQGSAQGCTCLCSSTLELGIDIGNVKAVGQVDTPWSVASMVQRMGRSGRKGNMPSILRMFISAESPNSHSSLTNLLYPDVVRAIAMVRLMIAKWLEPADMNRLHLSTLTHQIMSSLKQFGGMSPADLYRALIERGPFRLVSIEQFKILLRGLAERDIIEQTPPGDLILGLAGERVTAGHEFYAAFQGGNDWIVRSDEGEIGKLPAVAVPKPKQCIILAGRSWRVKELLEDSKVVLVVPSPKGAKPIFLSAGGEIHTRIVQEMREVLLGETVPKYLQVDGAAILQSARTIFRKAELDQQNIIVGKGIIHWYPWVGTRTMRTLQMHAIALGIAADMDDLGLHFHLADFADFLDYLHATAAADYDPDVIADSLPIKSFDKYDDFIPSPLLNVQNAHDHLDFPEAKNVAKREFLANSS